MMRTLLETLGRAGRPGLTQNALSHDQLQKLFELQSNGYTIIDKFVGSDLIKELQADYTRRLTLEFEVELPCLSQSKIDPEHHADLIEKNFLATPKQLTGMGLTFDRSDFSSYDQIVSEFQPSTLTMKLPQDSRYLSLWLDKDITDIARAYMGFTPLLTEAYIRRNFPARFKVMNHAWHRDSNHPKFLLKAFFFFSDCTLKTGPHHYLSGSIKDRRLDGKNYYTDEEVAEAYVDSQDKHIISVVPAGTIILEDTRGLHKAGVPEKGYRDLGYAVFTPAMAFRPPPAFYKVQKNIYDELTLEQKTFIPKRNYCSVY